MNHNTNLDPATRSTWKASLFTLSLGENPRVYLESFGTRDNGKYFADFTNNAAHAIRFTEEEAMANALMFRNLTGMVLDVTDLRSILFPEQLLLLRVFHPVENEWGDDA